MTDLYIDYKYIAEDNFFKKIKDKFQSMRIHPVKVDPCKERLSIKENKVNFFALAKLTISILFL